MNFLNSLVLVSFALGTGTAALAQVAQPSPRPSPRYQTQKYQKAPEKNVRKLRPQTIYKEPPGIFHEEMRSRPQQTQQQNRPTRRRYRERSQGPEVNLALTHILPSAYVIPSKTFVLGTTAGVGLFNFMDITSNLYLDVEQVYNVAASFALLQGRNFAVGARVAYADQSLQLNGINASTGLPDIVNVTSSSVSPGLTLSYRILRNFTGHTGGDYVIQSPSVPKSSLPERTALLQGTTAHQEFTVGLSQFVAMSVGGSYDFTYDVWGAGLSFHMGGLQLGVHYYLNVTQGSFMPILGWGFPTSY